MSAGPSLNHLVDEWKSNHSMPCRVVSCPSTDDLLSDLFASLLNVSSWPQAALSTSRSSTPSGHTRGATADSQLQLDLSRFVDGLVLAPRSAFRHQLFRAARTELFVH